VAQANYLVRPHPKAPLFQNEKDPRLVLRQIAEEVATGRYSASEKFLDVVRQAGLVSLFFFLRFIAAVNGPYHKLNLGLHLDLANFRQSDACMGPGARSAAIIPRGFYKSSVAGHGANTWEALRNPDIRIRIVSNIVERAHEFKSLSQRTFDSNPLVKELYPEYVPSKSSPRWNENEFVLPNRTRYFTEPTISAGGATGASEGIHVDFLCLDDLEGLDDLSSDHRSNMNMMAKKKWFNTNSNTLLVDKTSRIHLNGTFYGSDDIHSEIMKDAKKIHGYHDPEFPINSSGHWDVYYRTWKEDDVVVFPEVMDEKKYTEILEKDSWTALTQINNKPHDPALSEFYQYETKRCRLLWSERYGWVIKKGSEKESENWETEVESAEPRFVRLSSCDVVEMVDPAGTETGFTARTSRTAIGVVAQDAYENTYLLWNRTGYYNSVKMFDLIFEGVSLFGGAIRLLGCEKAAMQKIIKPLLQREREFKGLHVYIREVSAGGDKIARIRMNVGRALMRGRVFLAVGEEKAFEEERIDFPGNGFKNDTLDMFEKALVAFNKPQRTDGEPDFDDDDFPEIDEDDEDHGYGRDPVIGY